MSDPRARLLSLLTERSYAKRAVVLASGRRSDFFIDCKQTVLTAEGHALVGSEMLDAALTLDRAIESVAGVELGGCPLASAVALTSFQRGQPLDAVYVRKEAKTHGSARILEGDSHLRKGARVVILEDVVTTGGSTLQCAEKIARAGFTVAGVIALVDRDEGGRQAIESAGHLFESIFRRSDFPQ
ncbi:MAG: orotate phosphoribosyltransferase [Polyangiales bacterium]